MNHLVQGVSSLYVEAANRLKPKGTKTRVVAFVESYQDVAFWRLLLDEFESDSVTFTIMLPSNNKLERGKKSALAKTLSASSLGRYMLACVDSDYDYLMQGATQTSRDFLSNPYVIQTYAYAIENYQCYSGSLNQVCVQCTLNDNRLIDFEAFFELYSRIVFPLFAWNIWFYRNRRHADFPMQEFNNFIAIENVNVKSPQDSLMRLENKVRRKLDWLEKSEPSAVAGVRSIMEELPGLGVTETETYLYIQGHFLFERVLPKVMEPVLASLRHERETDIYKQAAHLQQRQNELSSYRHSQVDLTDALRENTHYRDSAPYGRMRERVRSLLKEFQTPATSVVTPEGGGEDK